ncbi:MAG: hypothetical protein RR643_05015 [Anaerorhabdus sp.]|uniref:hypothetical protein n=1 Tax=Anaerorhabdus sp. TaxID=1872524 RepID=UPI002FC7EC59
MKFILCQPAIKRFKWELEVCLTRLVKLGYSEFVLLFTTGDSDMPDYFRDKYGAEVHVYPDDRGMYQYQPSVRPYLWWKYLEENPMAEEETYVYLDSDTILRDRFDFSDLSLSPSCWYGSDCGHYLNLNYIKSCTNGEEVARQMCQIVGIDYSLLDRYNNRTGGAQWVICQPTAEYWKKVFIDTHKIYAYFNTVDSTIQKWTAEMWAQFYNMIYFGVVPRVHSELDFAWATDPIQRWDQVKIYHNAGVTVDMVDMFYKGQYDNGYEPFDKSFDHINPAKCTSKYVEAVKEVKMNTNG